jgi:regulator of protease activity HflC (stomatin/prohibitin superfamily)
MDKSEAFDVSARSVTSRPNRFLHRLVWLYGTFVVLVGALLSAAVWPIDVVRPLQMLAMQAVTDGFGAMLMSALLLALTPIVGTYVMTAARQHAPAENAMTRLARPAGWSLAGFGPGLAARTGQAVIVPLGAALIYASCWLLWPAEGTAPSGGSANFIAALAFGLAFPSLVAERTMQAFPAPQMPEAPSLRRLLLLTTVILAAAGCIEVGIGGGLRWLQWPAMALICLPAVIATELALRALARLFLPQPDPAAARAVTESVVASLLTGGPRAPGVLIRAHLGLDFARSWALAYLSAAAMPAMFVTALLCWAITGLKLVDLGQRGVYERFGAPVAVLGPGLHVLLPWPLGRLRPVEYGTLHSISVGTAESGADTEQIDAEATPPASMNHLWETAQPTEAQYLVASQSGGRQNFQVVSADIRVLYRTGLTDADALQAVYGAEDQEALVREAAGRILVRYFNSRTVDAVLGASRETLAEALRSELARNIAARKAGIEIVAVIIEAIHPPIGAAAAYHEVQAAEIKAEASISDETARAARAAGIAQQEVRQLTDSAQATAVETVQTATGEAYRFAMDRRATEVGPAFLLERSYGSLASALRQTPLTIIDHRLDQAQSPFVDLRPTGAPAAVSPAPSGTAGATNAPGVSASGNAGAQPAAPPAASGAARSLTPMIEDEQ